jgi:hypothetical protein
VELRKVSGASRVTVIHCQRKPVRRSIRTVFVVSGLLAAWGILLLCASNPFDFRTFYVAGELLRTHPHALYSLAAQSAAQKAAGNDALMPWAHPVPEGLLFVPLALVSCRIGFALWSALSLLMLAFSGYLLRDELLVLKPGAHYALMVFLYVPITVGLLAGQDHALFLLLWVLAWRNLKKGKDFTAGICAGLSLIRYQFALPALLCLIVLRKWKMLQGAAASAAAMVLVSLALVGTDGARSYLTLMRSLSNTYDSIAIGRMPTLRGLMLFVAPAHHDIAAVVAILSLLVWATVTIGKIGEIDTAFALATVVGILADFHAFSYEMVVLILPIAILLQKRPAWIRAAWLLAVACFTAGAYQLHTALFLAPLLLVSALWTGHTFARRGLPEATEPLGEKLSATNP